MKKVLIIAGSVLLVILIFGGFMLSQFIKAGKEIQARYEATVITDPDLSQVSDGEYIGECEWPMISVKVKVTVRDNQITEIEILKHNNGRGGSAEAILPKVIEAQSLEIDVISGATFSSTVILSAIENALTGN